jgi:hypothetical protein
LGFKEESWGLILDLFLKNGTPFGFGFMEYFYKLKPLSSQDFKHPLMNFVGVSAMHYTTLTWFCNRA